MGLPAKKAAMQLNVDRHNMGRADSFRFNITTHVVEENYDKAIEELRGFLDKDSEYPKFKERVERYVNHAIDLVNAIRAKRKFPGMNSLTIAKQQEIADRFKEHFDELQYVLKKIEKIQGDLRVDDVRSTVWVVKALIVSIFFVATAAFLVDASHGLLDTTINVIDDAFVQLVALLGL